jgi:hypothetical protein
MKLNQGNAKILGLLIGGLAILRGDQERRQQRRTSCVR